MIEITSKELDKIFRHGEETYPEECCGVLIAQITQKDRIIEARKMTNINTRSKNTRYNIDPMDLMKLEDELDEAEQVMIGIYHSHPDHPAKPSDYDRNHAWPNLSYMVMRTTKGVTEKITSWRLNETRDNFVEEEIVIINKEITER